MHKLCQQVAYFWDCTGVFYGPYVRVSLTGVKNPPLRAVRIDCTYGPYVYGRSLRLVRIRVVYTGLKVHNAHLDEAVVVAGSRKEASDRPGYYETASYLLLHRLAF